MKPLMLALYTQHYSLVMHQMVTCSNRSFFLLLGSISWYRYTTKMGLGFCCLWCQWFSFKTLQVVQGRQGSKMLIQDLVHEDNVTEKGPASKQKLDHEESYEKNCDLNFRGSWLLSMRCNNFGSDHMKKKKKENHQIQVKEKLPEGHCSYTLYKV